MDKYQRFIKVKDGRRLTVMYKAWSNMKQRCYSQSYIRPYNYSGRGITVCGRWLHSFENFVDDIGMRPAKGYSVDRIDNNGNYCPENCKWSTAKKQQANTRNRQKP